MRSAIIFDSVSMSYPVYQHVTGGFKNFLFNLPKSIRSLRQKYEAIKNISFEIQRGENFGLIGKNGAGKSTSLSLIANVLKPTLGHVTVNGRVSPLLELGAGFHPELTGLENIMLNGVLMGLSRAEVKQRLDEIVDFSELGEFIDQPVRMYSSGMTSKLGFSVIAHLNPEILLIDEVLAVGDILFQGKCMAKMESFRKREDVTFVLVSHSMASVRQVCDRVAWIDNHQLKKIGPTDEVIQAYEKAYGAQPVEVDKILNLPSRFDNETRTYRQRGLNPK